MKLPQKVTPADCVLAVAVPHTRAQFFDDLREPSKHFAKSIALSHAGASANFFWSEYQPTAKCIELVGNEVASQGVRVHYDCRLEDLATLLPTCNVLTLVAHLHYQKIRSEEILDPVGIAKRLRQPDSEICRLLHKQIGDDELSRLSFSETDTGQALPGQIAKLLNDLIDQKPSQNNKEPTDDTETIEGIIVPPLRFTRNQIEHLFVKELSASRPIEFSDGTHTVNEFVAAIPSDYSGVIDLCLCNSAVLVESIKRRSRHCTVISNEMPATPVIKLTRYKLAIHKLAKKAEPYIDVIIRIHTRG
jgi:hypothetical protein